MSPELIGVDFSSAPTRRKPIVLARGSLVGTVLRYEGAQHFDSLAAFGQCLASTPGWLGGFDLPFGLPRELVQQLGWPTGRASQKAAKVSRISGRPSAQ